jgi:hypothetical protein
VRPKSGRASQTTNRTKFARLVLCRRNSSSQTGGRQEHMDCTFHFLLPGRIETILKGRRGSSNNEGVRTPGKVSGQLPRRQGHHAKTGSTRKGPEAQRQPEAQVQDPIPKRTSKSLKPPSNEYRRATWPAVLAGGKNKQLEARPGGGTYKTSPKFHVFLPFWVDRIPTPSKTF